MRKKPAIPSLLLLPPNSLTCDRLVQVVKRDTSRSEGALSDEDAAGALHHTLKAATRWLHNHLGGLSFSTSRAYCHVRSGEKLNASISTVQRMATLVQSRIAEPRTAKHLPLSLLRLSALEADADGAAERLAQVPSAHLSIDHFHSAMAAANRTIIAAEWWHDDSFAMATNAFAKMARMGIPATYETVAHIANSVSHEAQLDDVAELLQNLISLAAKREARGSGATAIAALLAAVARVCRPSEVADRVAYFYRYLNVGIATPANANIIQHGFLLAAGRSGDPAKVHSSFVAMTAFTPLNESFAAASMVAGHLRTTSDLTHAVQLYLSLLRKGPFTTAASMQTCLMLAVSVASRANPRFHELGVVLFNAGLKKYAQRDTLAYAIAMNEIARRTLNTLEQLPTQAERLVALCAAIEDYLRLMHFLLVSDDVTPHPDSLLVLTQFVARTQAYFDDGATEEQLLLHRKFLQRVDAAGLWYLDRALAGQQFAVVDTATVRRVTHVPVNVDLGALGGAIAAGGDLVLDFHSLLSALTWSSSSPRRASLRTLLKRGGRVLSPTDSVLVPLRDPTVTRVPLPASAEPLRRTDVSPRFLYENAVDHFRLRVLPEMLENGADLIAPMAPPAQKLLESWFV